MASYVSVVDAAAGLLDFHPTLEVSGAVDSAASAELRADVLAVVREALSNVVRHAAAREYGSRSAWMPGG